MNYTTCDAFLWLSASVADANRATIRMPTAFRKNSCVSLAWLPHLRHARRPELQSLSLREEKLPKLEAVEEARESVPCATGHPQS